MRKYYLLLAAAVFLLTTWASAKDQPKFKSIEVKHFPNAEGVELPPEFELSAESSGTVMPRLAESVGVPPGLLTRRTSSLPKK